MHKPDVILFRIGDHAGVVPLFTFLFKLKINNVSWADAVPGFAATYFGLVLRRTWQGYIDGLVTIVNQPGAIYAGFGHAPVTIGGAYVSSSFGDYPINLFGLFPVLSRNITDHQKAKTCDKEDFKKSTVHPCMISCFSP